MDLSSMTLDIAQHVDIARPMEAVFDGLLQHVTDGMKYPDGRPMDFKLEAWPGGRWYRDLGDNNGHLWGHVQSIKRPTLLEFVGPMFMSYPVAGHIEYKLSEIEGGTRVSLRHRALGMIDDAHRQGVTQGWRQILDALKTAVES